MMLVKNKIKKKVKKNKINKNNKTNKINKTSKNNKIIKTPKNNKINKTNKPDSIAILFFLTKFFALFLLLTIVLESIDLFFLNAFITNLSSALIGLGSNGTVVSINGISFAVTNACTGLMSASILFALIFSLKKPTIVKKLALFLVGLVFLLVLNIPRVAIVLLSAKLGYNASLVHTITWFVMSLVILLIWFYGLKFFGVKDFSELI